jgi:hypothetical protein
MQKLPPDIGTQKITFELHLNAVERLVVYHLDEAIRTPMAIDPGQLHTFPGVRRFEVVEPQTVRAIYDALCGSELHLDPTRGFDARWSSVFIDRDGKLLLTAYADSFGLRGEIDGEIVRFTRSSFVHSLKRALSV